MRRSKQTTWNGLTYDSKTEMLFHQYLLKNKESLKIAKIELQPRFDLIPPFKIPCFKCEGKGKVKSEKTSKLINCKKCAGESTLQRRSMFYTADYLVTYINGHTDVFDVKGYKNSDKTFSYRKKVFEWLTGRCVIEVYLTNGKWVYK